MLLSCAVRLVFFLSGSMKTFLRSCSRAVSACLRGVVVVWLFLVGLQVGWGQTFVIGSAPSAAMTPYSVIAKDFDGDGDLDLAVANYGSNNVSILLNAGAGMYLAAINYAVGLNPMSITSGDFDNDGDTDLAVANYSSANVSILLNTGGMFAPAVNYAAGTGPTSVTAGDFDGDGDTDLAVTNWVSNNLGILLNSGGSVFAMAVNYGVGVQPWSAAVGDFDADGDLDLAVANYASTNISVLLNTGIGTYSTAISYGVGTNPRSVIARDIDGDGDLDLVTANNGSANVSVLRNMGGGIYGAAMNYSVGINPHSVASGDFDGDGDFDLVTANNSGNNVSILWNGGGGLFALAINYGAGASPISAATGDLDNDGDIDLAVANQSGNTVTILRNQPPAPTTFYFNIGDPSNTANWGSNPGGTGTPPADFTTAGNTYIMETGKTGALAGNLTFGAGTTFTMQPSSTLNLNARDLSLNGNINLNGAINGTFGVAGSVFIGGSGTLTGSLASTDHRAGMTNFHNYLTSFTFNRAGQTFASGGSTYVQTSFQILAGTIQADGQRSLTIQGTGVVSAGATLQIQNSAGTVPQVIGNLTNNGNIVLDANSLFVLQSGTITNGGSISSAGIISFNGTTPAITGNAVMYSGGGGISYADLTAPLTTTNIEFPPSVGFFGVANNSQITLNGSKSVSTWFGIQNMGSLNIGANTLTVNGTIFQNTGGVIVGNALSSLVIGGTGTITGNLTFSGSNQLQNLTINRAGLTIPLGSPLTVSGTLTLTNGILNTNGNTLDVSNPATNAVPSGSAASYVQGGFSRAMLPNIAADGTSYFYPIGDASNYRPLTLQNVRTGAGTPSVTASLVAGTPSAGTGLTAPFADASRTWFVNALGPFTSSELLLSNLPTLAGTARLGLGANAVGAYNRINSMPSGTSISSVGQITGGFGTTNRFVAIGTGAAATYTWNLPGSGSWIVPGNWSPSRISPSPDDILRIETANTDLNINNVPTETIGQLIIGGGNGMTLAPGKQLQAASPGNTLTITGGAGDDVLVPAGNTFWQLNGLNISLQAGTNYLVNGGLLTENAAVQGAGLFTLNGSLEISNPQGVNGTSAGTGTIQNTGGITYNPAATIGFWGTSANSRFEAVAGKPAITTLSSMYAGNGVTLTLTSSVTVTGNLTLTDAGSRLAIGANTLSVGDVSRAAGSAIIGSAASNLTITKAGSVASPLAFQVGGQILNNLTFTAAGGVAGITSPLTIAGTLSLPNASNILAINGQNLTLGDFSGIGFIVADNLSNITLTRTSAMTSPLKISATPALQSLTLNGAGLQATLNNGILNVGQLNLTSGILNTDNTNILNVGNVATGAISGGSATSYVNGPLVRAMNTNIVADGTSYAFPVGDAGGYRPLNLNNVRTGAVSPVVRVTVAPSGATTPGMGTGINTPFAEGGRNWHVEQVSGNFNSATVELFANGLTADSRAARSTAQAGPYDRVGQTGGGASVVSDPGQTPGYFAIGTRALQTVLWTGGGMAGNWNDPANWGGGPVPNGADFQARFNGGTIALTSGLPMTLGSLLVEGGATVNLQQATTLNLTAVGQAVLVRGSSILQLGGTNLTLASATATASIEAGSMLSLDLSTLTLGPNGSVDMAGQLRRNNGAITGGASMPVSYTSGAALVYTGNMNITSGSEFPGILPTGVSLTVNTGAGAVLTLSDSKTVNAVTLTNGRVAIPAGATMTIQQPSSIGLGGGFDLAAMSVLELQNAALTNNNPIAGATGGINVQAGGTLRLRDAATVTNNPAFYAAAASTLEFAGSTAKTTNLQELPATMTGTVLLNNGGGITLDAAARTIQGGLTLTNGILTTPVALTIDQNAALTGGSATAHVRTSGTGTFGRILPPNLVMSATPYLYPIGDASGYRPFTLTNVSTGVTPVTTALSTSPSGATSVGAGLQAPFVESGRNWKFDVVTGTLSSTQITLQTASGLNPTLNRVGFSSSGQAGVYDRTQPSGGTVAGLTITSDAVNFPAAPATRHFAIANLATTFYYISGDPALAASWRTDAAGTGGTPLASDFTTSGRTFIIPTPRTATLATPLTFGAGVNFTMEAGTTLNGGSQALTLGAGGMVNIAGTIVLDGTSTLVAKATPVIQNGGTVRLVGNMSAVTMNPPLYQSGSNLVYDNRTTAVGLEFPPAPASNPMLGNVQLGGMMGASTMTFNSSTSFAGNFTLQGASQLAIGGMNTDIHLGGAINFGTGTITGTGNSILRVNGSGAVNGALSIVPPTALQFFDLSRPVRITLAAPLHLQTLALQGTLDTRTNATTVRMTGGSGSFIQNGTGAVDGNLEWQLPANISADGQSFQFPLSQGGSPRTITLQNIRTGADAPTVRLRFDSTGAMTASASGGLSAVQPANWRVEVITGNFLSSIIALNEANYQTTNRIGTSTAQAGQYDRVSSGAAQTTSRLDFSPPTATRFFAVGTTSTTPKRYTLRNGGDPAIAADWRDSLGVGAPDFITSNSEFVIPVTLAPVRLGADLTLGDGVSLVVKAGAKLTIPDGRKLQLGSGGMLVEAGTTLSMNIGGTVEVEGSGLITGGSSVYAGTTATLRYTGGGMKTATESEFPLNFGGSLVMNRGGSVALTQQRTIAGTLSLQNGILQVASAQALVLTNPQLGALTGGSATSFVAGALQRAILPNLRGDSALSYSFPVGSATRFLPLTVLQPLTGTGGALFRAEGVADSARGSLQAGLIALSPTEYWRTQLQSGSLSGLVQLGGVNFATANVISSSASVGGAFTSARGLRSGSDLVSERIALQSTLVLAAAEARQPTVQSVIPTTAAVGGLVTINGTNFAGVQMLDFGGTPTTAFQISGSQITVNVPQGAQTGALRIISAAGTLTAAQNFTVRTLALPTISTIQPPEAAPGERLTIQGANLSGAVVVFRSAQSTTQATVSISVQPLTNSATQIVVQVPNNATSGTIVITTPNGTATSATVFRVLPATDTSRAIAPLPTITDFSPNVADSGQTITIRGTNLRSTSGSASTSDSTTVLLGTTPARVLSQSDTELTVLIPSNTASGLITITTPAGTVTSQFPFTTRADSLRAAQNLLPQITAIQPDSARVSETIRILGRNLGQVTEVQIGSGLVTERRIISPNEIQATVPSSASSGPVILTHPTGRVQSPAGISFTLVRPPVPIATGAPTITGFSRDTVRVGDTLSVRGTNLTALDLMQFSHGGVYTMNVQTVISSSATALVVIVPRPPDTTGLRLFTFFVRNAAGATTANFGARALWIIPTRPAITIPSVVVDSARLRDSLALMSFFQTTNGDAWRNRAGWATSAPISGWFGVTLENNRVARLVLPNNNLRSRGLPPQFENLTSLRIVNLSGNLIGDETGLVRLLALPNLEELQLAECAFSGRLDAMRPAIASQPARTLCTLTRLRVLNLAGNSFSGSLPACLGSLTELRELNLANNTLTGDIPSGFGRTAQFLAEKGAASLTALANLQSLNLSGNQLSGTLPADIAAITTLRSLRLAQNRLRALPNLAALSLDTLTLGGNALTFAHLEQFVGRRFSLLEYSGQDSVGAVRALTRVQGDTLLLQADDDGSGSTTTSSSGALYEWFRDGVSLRAPRNRTNGGNVLSLGAVRLPDAGVYSYRVTHSALPALTLFSRPQTLTVRPQNNQPQDTVASALLPPRLIAPGSGSRNVALRPLLRWTSVAGALRYDVEVRSASAGASSQHLEQFSVQNDTAQRLSTTLPFETRFQWRVRAIALRAQATALDTSAWSENGIFTTVPRNIALGVSTFNFGKVLIDEVVQGEIAVTNTGETAITLRNISVQASENEFRVDDDVANVRLQPGESVPVQVSYQPRDTVRQSIGLAVAYVVGAEVQTFPAAQTLEGRGVPLEIRPLDFGTVLVGRTFLRSAQVVNRSVYNLSLDSLFVQASNAASEGVFSLDRGALVQSGKLFLGSGDTTTLLVRCRALQTGSFSGTLRLASSRIDTLEVPLLARARERLPSDIIAKIGLRAEPAIAKPGDTVRLRLFLAEGSAVSLFTTTEVSPIFSARFRFDKYVLQLANEQGGKARSIINTDPRNRVWRSEINARAVRRLSDADFLAEQTVPCIALNADVLKTALVLENFSWGDARGRTFWFESASPSEFVLQMSSANGSPRLFAVDTLNAPLPSRLALQAISPNPAEESIEIVYRLLKDDTLTIAVFSADGRKVASVLERQAHAAGEYRLIHRVASLPSGAYLLVAETPTERMTQRLEVVR